jgi:hypothetical protein
MTVTNKPEQADAPMRSAFTSGLRILLAGIGALFFAGTAFGFLAAHDWRSELGPLPVAITVSLAAIALLCVWQLLKGLVMLSRKPREELAPSVRTTNRLTAVSCLLGGAFAAILAIGEMQIGGSDSLHIFSSAPIPAWAAISLIAITLTAIPWLTLAWHRVVDEYEWQAYRDGALAAVYAYSALSLCWWLAWRAGLLPAVDGVAVFFVTYAAWCGVWLWRRSR